MAELTKDDVCKLFATKLNLKDSAFQLEKALRGSLAMSSHQRSKVSPTISAKK
jgi:hypothetical protein